MFTVCLSLKELYRQRCGIHTGQIDSNAWPPSISSAFESVTLSQNFSGAFLCRVCMYVLMFFFQGACNDKVFAPWPVIFLCLHGCRVGWYWYFTRLNGCETGPAQLRNLAPLG